MFRDAHQTRTIARIIGYIEGIKPLYEAVIDNAKRRGLKTRVP